MRDRCAVPRTFPQCVCTQRRIRIGRLSSSSEYAPGTIPFPARKSATIKLIHYPAVVVGQIDCGRIAAWKLDRLEGIFRPLAVCIERVNAARSMIVASILWSSVRSAALNALSVARQSKIGTRLGFHDFGLSPVQPRPRTTDHPKRPQNGLSAEASDAA
jgi:hypothetical protein